MDNPRVEALREAAHQLAPDAIAEGFKPEALHEYRTTDGSPLFWRTRAKRDDGQKWIRPIRLNGHRFELKEPDFPGGRPLYNLDQIARDRGAPVWVCEGEKACDALAKLGALQRQAAARKAQAALWLRRLDSVPLG